MRVWTRGSLRVCPVAVCGMCAGAPMPISCMRCRGAGRVGGIRARRVLVVRPRISLEKVKMLGFGKVGVEVEHLSDGEVSTLVARWYQTSAPRARAVWEGQLARGGWFRPPPPLLDRAAGGSYEN